MKLLLILISSFLVFSCSSVFKTVNGLNKQKEFEKIEDYEKYVVKRFKLDADDLYYFNKENYAKKYQDNFFVKESVFFLKGVYDNSNCSYLIEGATCTGTFENQLSTIDWTNCVEALDSMNNPLFIYKFYDSKGELISYEQDKKYALVYFSHNFGALHKKRLKILYESIPDDVMPIILSADESVQTNTLDSLVINKPNEYQQN